MKGGEQDRWDPLLPWAQQTRRRLEADVARAAGSADVRWEWADRVIERLAEHNPPHAERLRAIRAAAARRRAGTGHGKHGQPASRAGDQLVTGPQDPAAASTAGLEAYLRDMAAVAERDRIAAELQASVIQRIFAAGLTLQSAAGLTIQPEVRSRISTAADGLDEVIHLIRDAIFDATDQSAREPGSRPQTSDPDPDLP